MKNQALTIALLATAACLLGACSGNGWARVAGNRCSRDLKLFDERVAGVPQKGEIPISDLPVGDFEYLQSKLLYMANDGAPENYRIQVEDEKLRNGTFSSKVACVRYARPNMPAFSIGAPAPAKLKVGNDKSAELPSEPIGFVRGADGALVIFTPHNPLKNKPSEKITDGVPAEQWLVKISDTEYEIRSQGTAEHGRYYSTTRFKLLQK